MPKQIMQEYKKLQQEREILEKTLAFQLKQQEIFNFEIKDKIIKIRMMQWEKESEYISRYWILTAKNVYQLKNKRKFILILKNFTQHFSTGAQPTTIQLYDNSEMKKYTFDYFKSANSNLKKHEQIKSFIFNEKGIKSIKRNKFYFLSSCFNNDIFSIKDK